MTRYRALLALVLTTLVSGACSSMPGAATDDDVVELRRRIHELQLRTTMAEEEIDHLKGRIGELEGAQGEGRADTGTEGVDRAPVVEADPVRAQPPAMIEETDLDPPPVARAEVVPEGVAPREPEAGAAITGTTAPSGGGLGPVSAAGQELYDRGYTLFHQGRYVDSESTFQRFLQGWPDTELADNAWYWIGEARFARDDISGALAAFSEVVRRYGSGNKAPDALFKAGRCQERLGDVQGARSTYQEVLRLFPQTAAAVSAQEGLDSLR